MVAKTKNSLTQTGKKSGREKFLEDRESLVKVEGRSERGPTELITWLRILFCAMVYYSLFPFTIPVYYSLFRLFSQAAN